MQSKDPCTLTPSRTDSLSSRTRRPLPSRGTLCFFVSSSESPRCIPVLSPRALPATLVPIAACSILRDFRRVGILTLCRGRPLPLRFGVGRTLLSAAFALSSRAQSRACPERPEERGAVERDLVFHSVILSEVFVREVGRKRSRRIPARSPHPAPIHCHPERGVFCRVEGPCVFSCHHRNPPDAFRV
jgi:hypothetical protein